MFLAYNLYQIQIVSNDEKTKTYLQKI